MYTTEKSKAMFESAKHSLVGGVASSIHKGAWQEYPIYLERGKGTRIYDIDGNEYIDYMMAFGPAILGYSPDAINQAVIKQLEYGTQLAAPTASLIELCNKIVDIIPCAEKVSTFLCSGSEANIHAIRLARAYTGKMKVIKFEGHYHGWLDEEKVSCSAPSEEFMGPRNNPWPLRHFAGQKYPDDVIILPYNDLEIVEETLRRRSGEIACVIMESVMFNASPVFPKPGFLEGLRELTKKYGVVLIFDEVITGFRLSLGGAQQYFGVTPDLATFAKAMAGGYPVSVVAGKEEIVSSGTATAGTFNGNPLVVAASLAVIDELSKPGTYAKINELSEMMVKGWYELGRKYDLKLYSRALGAIWTIQFGIDEPIDDYRDSFKKIDSGLYQKVCKGALENGVRLNPWYGRGYMSTAHTADDISKTLAILDQVMGDIIK